MGNGMSFDEMADIHYEYIGNVAKFRNSIGSANCDCRETYELWMEREGDRTYWICAICHLRLGEVKKCP